MEFQLQIYLILGVGGFLLAALILSNSLLIYYLSKLYRKQTASTLASAKSSQTIRNAEEPPQVNAYNNPALDIEEELNRRFTQYTPEPTLEREPNTKSNKGTEKSPNPSNIKNVIDVSEEFRWRKSESKLNDRTTSQFNSNIVLKNDDFISEHEGRTNFNDY